MIAIFLAFLLFGFHKVSAENLSEIPSNDNGYVLNAVIRQMFELFRNVVINGDPEKDIPILDPYEFDYATFGITGDVISASVNFTQCVFTGLSDYQLGPFTFDKSSLSIDLQLGVPLITLICEYYKLEGKLFELFSMSGNGVMDIDVHNILVNGKIYLKQSDDEKSILINHFENLEFTIDTIKSETQFDGNIDGIVNSMIADLLPDYLSRFNKAISATYGGMMVEVVNSILDKYENWKIIAVIL